MAQVIWMNNTTRQRRVRERASGIFTWNIQIWVRFFRNTPIDTMVAECYVGFLVTIVLFKSAEFEDRTARNI